MKKQIISFSLVAAGFLIGATALTALADWSSPSGFTPPACPSTTPGCNPPINVGWTGSGITQEKFDSLKIDGGLGVLGNLSIINGNMSIVGGTPVTGQVLTATNVTTDVAGVKTATVGWGAGGGGSSVTSNAKSASLTTAVAVSTSVWTNTGLSITITPTSLSSKMLIISDMVATVVDGNTACSLGLFRDSTALVAPYGTTLLAGSISSPNITYIDQPNSTLPVTYKIMMKRTFGSDICRINNANYSPIKGNTLLQTQTMSVVQIQ